MHPLYFSSPKESVNIISELLERQEWATLSRYYDMTYTKATKKEMLSGNFFIKPKNENEIHYKPFDPDFLFLDSHIIENEYCIVELTKELWKTCGVRSDASDFFFLHKVKNGYQIISEIEI